MLVLLAGIVVEMQLAEPWQHGRQPVRPGGLGKGAEVADIEAESHRRSRQVGQKRLVGSGVSLVGVFQHDRHPVFRRPVGELPPGGNGVEPPAVKDIAVLVFFVLQVADDGFRSEDSGQVDRPV